MVETGKIYNTLEFGGINSGDYGVYITGTGVYNAPARAVEMVSVPGRNGDVPIDMGHWDNIEVTYKCGLFGIDQSEMGEALMEFRNAIASQIGYQRLSDSYNPNEFRLGLFMAGLEFDAVSMNRAGEFELKFNCKPQRFLTDGEEMIDVKTDWSDLKTASGEVVTFEVADDAAANYTQFKSLVADIDPIQDLSHGAPSPENICPISGWDSVEAVVSPTESAEDGHTHTATFDETVYGGTVDLVSGVLNSKPYYASYNGETLTGEWISDRDEYVAGTTPTIGAQVVNIGADGTDTQLDPQTINTLVGVNSVWANSGDVAVEYGLRPGVLVNPTQYESSPVIEIEGTGSIGLNDYLIAIDGGSVGEVELASERRVEPIMAGSYPSTITETIDMATTMSLLEDGDAFNISTLTASWLMGDTTKETYTITQQPTDGVASIETATSPRVSAVARFSQLAFAKGEAKTFAEEFIVSGRSSRGTGSVTFSVDVNYDGSHTLTISYGVAIHPLITGVVRSGSYSDIGEIIGNSSKQTFSGQVIIDSETGDAYRIEDGTYISLNKYIQLGAQLPTLRPGANIITYDDTITSLQIAPRWWRL